MSHEQPKYQWNGTVPTTGHFLGKPCNGGNMEGVFEISIFPVMLGPHMKYIMIEWKVHVVYNKRDQYFLKCWALI